VLPPVAVDDVLVGVHQLLVDLGQFALSVLALHLFVPFCQRDFRHAKVTVRGM
jgi:hypothetical protein